MENMFEQASREKLRFEFSKGLISTEELWSLSLANLDSIAKGINKTIKEESEESFIKPRSNSNKTLELKLEIVKHVISVRMKEAEDAKTKSEKQAQLSTLNGLLEAKKLQELSNLSSEEIEKKIAALQE